MLVRVCRCSKFLHFFQLRHTYRYKILNMIRIYHL